MKHKTRRQNPAEICSFCGEQAARLHLKNQTFGQGDRMIVIENVPTFVCDNCHESYITADVSRAIDEILAHPNQHTSRREVSVATLAA
ncbi:MAG: type II toxin-antitoxin system MqsA family antitoxin [Blastocatellia bacterium]